MEKKLYAVALSTLSSPALLRIWDSIEGTEPRSLYGSLAGGAALSTQDFLRERYSAVPLEAAGQIIHAAEKKSIRIIDYWSGDYPGLLRETARPPLVLYARGDLPSADSVAVVGTRKADPRSKAMARRITGSLCAAGFTVVSGMAIGIDREAHEAALDSAGTTVGVMANGIDIMYPSSNRDLYRRMLDSPGSGLVSEYPPGIYTRKWTFVRRNRIISGLSRGTVVVKAGARSGALITADYALEQNREVFACAGYSLDPEYEGCHRLIQKGAVVIAAEDDVVTELRHRELFVSRAVFNRRKGFPGTRPPRYEGPPLFGGGAVEEAVIELLRKGEADIDSLARKSGFSVSEVNEAVIMLELSGRIIKNGNMVAAL
ncbi:MAG TPA: DNA-processing protein DprA [Spirochaetota bacterium]|nr:DNA-processing protein DprA [Spirochaetota bacterium]HPI91225.1 DNA-processing protein DprA [Spirochaetota bacterium]HPR50044.1 DNA-processing protein DprA [Spirochaetota bacterium]